MAQLLIINRYAQVPNSIINNKELSFKAKGIWAYLQSKPDGWNFSAKRIQLDSKDGRDSVLAGLKELEDLNYLRRVKTRNSVGMWKHHYELFESPDLPEPCLRGKENPTPDNPSIKKESINKDNISTNVDIVDSSKSEDTKPRIQFNSSEWVASLAESPQAHIRLIGYYFGLYSEHNFPTKKVANDELIKNVKPATYLLANYEKKDISKTLKYCAEKFTDVHWNLHTVKKQISYVTAKKNN